MQKVNNKMILKHLIICYNNNDTQGYYCLYL